MRGEATREAPPELLELGDRVLGADEALCVPAGAELVVALDTMVAGIHFPPDTSAADVACKAIAVNLSDLAAMGADALGVGLTLSAPVSETAWLSGFATGFAQTLDRYDIGLAAFEFTPGEVVISVQISGCVPEGQALLRSGAQVGDSIWVSGSPGDARLGLELALDGSRLEGQDSAHPSGKHAAWLSEDRAAAALARLNRPSPRLPLGRALRGIATAAIDVSDGLAQDLGHILRASGCTAELRVANLPRSKLWAGCPDETAPRDATLCGGDDYELCFTAAPAYQARLAALESELNLSLTEIGRITGPAPAGATASERLTVIGPDGERLEAAVGYDHFR